MCDTIIFTMQRSLIFTDTLQFVATTHAVNEKYDGRFILEKCHFQKIISHICAVGSSDNKMHGLPSSFGFGLMLDSRLLRQKTAMLHECSPHGECLWGIRNQSNRTNVRTDFLKMPFSEHKMAIVLFSMTPCVLCCFKRADS